MQAELETDGDCVVVYHGSVRLTVQWSQEHDALVVVPDPPMQATVVLGEGEVKVRDPRRVLRGSRHSEDY